MPQTLRTPQTAIRNLLKEWVKLTHIIKIKEETILGTIARKAPAIEWVQIITYGSKEVDFHEFADNHEKTTVSFKATGKNYKRDKNDDGRNNI